MPLFYALIARGKNVVLAEYTARTGNFATVTRVLLGKIGAEDAKMSYVYGAWEAEGGRCGVGCAGGLARGEAAYVRARVCVNAGAPSLYVWCRHTLCPAL